MLLFLIVNRDLNIDFELRYKGNSVVILLQLFFFLTHLLSLETEIVKAESRWRNEEYERKTFASFIYIYVTYTIINFALFNILLFWIHLSILHLQYRIPW